jgi:predicted AlkP superfamily phosphohydrolase/phosphomutase
VAWSNFITGQTSAGHGIYDFIHRDLDRNLQPYLSTSRTTPPKNTIEVGSLRVPLSSGSVRLLRKGRPFWEYLEDHSIPATVIKIPSDFPPTSASPAQVISGMGTPDLLGTYGTFHLFTNDPRWVEKKVAGGRVQKLDFSGGQHARSALIGPTDPLDAHERKLRLPLEFVRDRKRAVAMVRIAGQKIILCPGEWSAWIPLSFDPGWLGDEIPAIVRFYLKALRPHVLLYASPLNIDPIRPAMPISSPSDFGKTVAQDVGRYYTQGMAEDTKALEAGVLTDREFLTLANHILNKRTAMLQRALKHFRGGLLFFYFSSIDQTSHMFWRTLDPDAPPAVRKHKDVLYKLYARMDAIVGQVLAKMDDQTELLIMSDHGFAPCKRNFQLNTWLARQGYLVTLPAEKQKKGFMGHIDWSKTQAYGLGLNQIFVNLKGREPHGVVVRGERDALARRIGRQLEAYRDPDTGQQVVTRTFLVEYGPNKKRAPDLIVGYNRGYRCASDSAMGRLADRVVEPNDDKWSGDHCMDPALVPGVFFSTRPTQHKHATLLDLAPTTLDYFGVSIPKNTEGKSLFKKPKKSGNKESIKGTNAP